MTEYVKPTYNKEGIDTSDIILASLSVAHVGEGTLGNISGAKAEVSTDFNSLFATR